jgi:hypothetical protein
MAFAGNLILNPGFEVNGGAGSTSIANWTIVNQPGSIVPGSWFAQAGTVSPANAFAVPPPPGGLFTAMTDQNGGGSHALLQTFTVPGPGAVTLSFQYFRFNQAGAYFTPNSLDFNVNPNQQARVDILTAGAGAFDLGAAVLLNALRTNPGDPLHDTAYQNFLLDITPIVGAGGTFQLRFTEVDNQLFFDFGVDNVSVDFTAAGIPEPSTWLLLSGGLVSLGFLRRRA